MALVEISNLTFGYDGSFENVFENVNVRFDTAWRLGLTGRNGRGKTTLLKLMTGAYEYQGKIDAPVRFDYFPFEVKDMRRTGRAIVEEIVPEMESWRLDCELAQLEMDGEVLGRPFDTLSMGERTKLMLAALFLREGDFLLIDEPTNHLDMHARDVTSRYLQGKDGFLLVSHDRAFLDVCVDHILSINRTDIDVQRGNFSSWMQNKRLRDAFEQGENDRLNREIGRLNAAARRSAGWSDEIERSKIGTHAADRGAIGHKAAKMMKRSKAVTRRREEAAQEKTQLLRNIEAAEPLGIKPLSHHAPRIVQMDHAVLRYGERTVLEDVCLTVAPGQRIALTGPNGCGKSSLLKLVLGECAAHEGLVRRASGLVISYVPQDTSHLAGGLAQYAQACGIDMSLFLTILRKLDFSRAQFEKRMEHFSGGQKKKVLIARSLCEQAHLYVWDEPLNFVDVFSRMQIEQVILDCAPTMLFVEHDKKFVEAVATDTLQIEGRGRCAPQSRVDRS